MNTIIKTESSISLEKLSSKSIIQTATSTAASRVINKIASNTITKSAVSSRFDAKT